MMQGRFSGSPHLLLAGSLGLQALGLATWALLPSVLSAFVGIDASFAERPIDHPLEAVSVEDIGIDRHLSASCSKRTGLRRSSSGISFTPDGSAPGILANENRARDALRRLRVLVRKRHEQDTLAWCGIREADPAWKTGLAIRDVALRAPRSQLLIAKSEERRERFER